MLKSYIDHIVRPKRTFAVDDSGFRGLVTGKKLLFITARGSDFRPGSSLAPLDFQEPYLKTVFDFIGIKDTQFINTNGLRTGIREQSLASAKWIVLKKRKTVFCRICCAARVIYVDGLPFFYVYVLRAAIEELAARW